MFSSRVTEEQNRDTITTPEDRKLPISWTNSPQLWRWKYAGVFVWQTKTCLHPNSVGLKTFSLIACNIAYCATHCWGLFDGVGQNSRRFIFVKITCDLFFFLKKMDFGGVLFCKKKKGGGGALKSLRTKWGCYKRQGNNFCFVVANQQALIFPFVICIPMCGHWTETICRACQRFIGEILTTRSSLSSRYPSSSALCPTLAGSSDLLKIRSENDQKEEIKGRKKWQKEVRWVPGGGNTFISIED